ncbi:molybdopterin-dependent oxidoreductase [Panacibacter ginsenosidivorans]|uniref:Molybdopterin-dependent oxidoreductase n=1 Tax=Panacibacter ginsenosidivorans TaxID=1813871 RepID=A0A5B8VC97_9BACT|nr:molybdopterin-dependent oxidoreductase [Panacibacter ginsenosidivorans]QEC69147.1 molybdopterin-dependent oxidoreductase [Panacibacter ginsenosidivorans]
MFTSFTKEEKAIHYPADRRTFIAVKPYMLVIFAIVILLPVVAAWLQYLIAGLPADPGLIFTSITPAEPNGFPIWVNLSHWVNFFFLVLIIRSGLSILVDHPRLYWNNGCKPGTDWIRFTPLKKPKDKSWTAKEDARYISPVLGLPGYRHTIGIARVWHFITVPFFILNGVVFIILLFTTNQWLRLIPTSWKIIPDSWNVFVHYATFNLPVEPNGYYHFNALQQLSYFAVVFILAPLAMFTGMAMSPAIENRFHWYPKLFGNRQSARSIHFLIMIAYVIFIMIHVSMIAATGLVRNMNHIIWGTDDTGNLSGLYIGIAIIFITVGFGFIAHWFSWRKPRLLQQLNAVINENLWRVTLNRFKPKAYYHKNDISPYFWANGKMPTSETWRKLAENNFKDYKLKIGGLVGNPVELSLQELKNLGMKQTITMHHCIQGWSGIAEWGGLPISKIIELVKPHATVTTVAFYSFGEGLYGGYYYDTNTFDNCLKPQSILAWEMNYETLPLEHGAPLRLRVENQLGYKMVKWISSIEFLETHKIIGKGFGGKNEDDEYFDLLANT